MRRVYQFVLAMGLGLITSGAVMAQAKGAPAADKAAIANAPGFYYGYGQTPWFGAPAIRQHLNLNPTQYRQLNQAYGKAWNSYRNSMSNLGTPSGNQLNSQTQQYYSTFNNTLGQSAQNTLNPQQYQRYLQLSRQYQGFGAFSDPAVQQELKLTAPQRQQFDKYAREFNQNLNGMINNNNNATGGFGKAYSQMRNEMSQRINTILTPQQRQAWQRITGDPYNNFVPPLNNP